DATEQFFAESKKPAKTRGPDKRPRRPRATASPVALDDVGHDAGAPHLDSSPPVPLALYVPPEPTFDEAAATALVEIALGLLNDGAAAIVTAVAKKETGDAALAREAGQSVRMSDKIEAAVKRGACECAKKYSVSTKYSPEVLLGGGLLIWTGQVTLAIKGL